MVELPGLCLAKIPSGSKNDLILECGVARGEGFDRNEASRYHEEQ